MITELTRGELEQHIAQYEQELKTNKKMTPEAREDAEQHVRACKDRLKALKRFA